ncbi:hypothetical protein [Haliea salexigens]|uniref:hypothetical protein n=1 Tax=Haliea salexigens TaxID=287487 RepID=UPI0004061619|nr:hypothetical protein [Haliea salexigens]|tara:strand:- start:46 stop:330 length:285 start_codon:yes stop_codon:yes gene_type:complete
MTPGSARAKRILAALSTCFAVSLSSPALASGESLCDLMPIAIEDSVLAPLAVGDLADQISIKQAHGNFGWLTWAGSPSSPVLANSLTLPGDSDT